MRVSAQFVMLAAGTAISIAAMRRAVPTALSNPCGFPDARWGWPEGLLSGGMVALFLAMAAGSAGHPAAKIDLEDVLKGLALYAGIIFFVLGALVFRGFDLVRGFGLRVGGWGSRTVAGWLLLFLPPIFLIQSAAYYFAGPDQSPQPIVDFLMQSKGWDGRIAVAVVAVVAAPLTEELLFRGCLYGVIRSSYGRLPAILATSVLFALIHGHAPSLPGLIVLAAGLALIYERCGSLWAPVAMHASFNCINVIGALVGTEFFR